MLRQSKTLGMLILILLVSSCGSKQLEKPVVSDCRIILEAGVAFCIENQTGRQYDVDLNQLDKWVAFSPEDWSKILIYVKLLERRVQGLKIKKSHKRLISNELNKFIIMDEKHHASKAYGQN